MSNTQAGNYVQPADAHIIQGEAKDDRKQMDACWDSFEDECA
jgi:hypothetical protein